MPELILPGRREPEAPAERPDLVRLDGSFQWGRELLGSKAAGIVGMRRQGIPVPPGFALTTEVCRRFQEKGPEAVDALWDDIQSMITWLGEEVGYGFGDARGPMLVSVRSGAALSMPGMMDTILNLGIDDDVEAGLAGAVSAEHARDVRKRFSEQFQKVTGAEPPADPWAQLREAICAVFASWESPRAVAYRRHHGIPDTGGTAVTVQAMVFGNRDERSGTGVLFTRNPLTGEAEPFGEWLPMGQGEDVVAGIATPQPLSALHDSLPEIHDELLAIGARLEANAHDMQDIEFTVEAGRLWLLQTRSAKRSPHAAVRIALGLQRRGVVSEREALELVRPAQVRQVLAPGLDPADTAGAAVLARGLPACAGVGSGIVVVDADLAEEAADEGMDVVLCRETTNPDDIHGIIAATALVTEFGGSTSHAAVVSREIGRPCVVGCGADALAGLAGREITVDGEAGIVYAGRLPLRDRSERTDADLSVLLEWARRYAPVTADFPDEAAAGAVDADEYTTEDELRAAVEGGVHRFVTDHPLPVLMALLSR